MANERSLEFDSGSMQYSSPSESAVNGDITPLVLPPPLFNRTTAAVNAARVPRVDSGAVFIAPSMTAPRLILNRNESSLSRIKRNLADYTGRYPPSPSREISPERKPLGGYQGKIMSFARKNGTASSSKSTSTVNSPEIQALIKHEVVPDLDAVNRALEAVSSSPDDSDEEKAVCVNHLSALAARLKLEHRDAKKLLSGAMQMRSAGKTEICRGMCMEIIHNPLAEVETKVYAYNILSTQASLGQGEKFLDSSEALVQGHIKDRREMMKLLDVIKILRQSVKEKFEGVKTAGASESERKDELESKMSEYQEGDPREEGAGQGAVTPNTRNILRWATGESRDE